MATVRYSGDSEDEGGYQSPCCRQSSTSPPSIDRCGHHRNSYIPPHFQPSPARPPPQLPGRLLTPPVCQNLEILRPLSGKLSNACLLRDDERLLVAEVYNSSIIRYLEEPSEVISLIRDGDRLVAYRLPKDSEDAPAVGFRNQCPSSLVLAGSPGRLLALLLCPLFPAQSKGSTIYNLFLKVLTPFRVSKDDISDADQMTCESSLVNETADIDTLMLQSAPT